jgi:hypothetical protein
MDLSVSISINKKKINKQYKINFTTNTVQLFPVSKDPLADDT